MSAMVNSLLMAFVWLFLAIGPALAQEADGGPDVHGETPPPPAVGAASPMLLWSPPDGSRRSAVRVLAEVADRTATRLERPAPGAQLEEAASMSTFAALDLGANVHLGGPLSGGLSVPVVLFSQAGDLDADGVEDGGGPTLGDLALSLPVAIVARPLDEGFGLGAVPWVRVPTGNARRFLGDPGLALGALVAVGFGAPAARIDGNVGVAWTPPVERATQQLGGWEVPAGVAGSVRVGRDLWLGAEVRSTVTVGGVAVAVDNAGLGSAGTPVEAFITVRLEELAGGRLSAAGAIGTGLSGGLGAARVRGLAGMGYTFGPDPTQVPWRFQVLNLDGAPVAGAEVREGNRAIAITGADGRVAVGEVRWTRGIQVVAPQYAPRVLGADPPSERDVEVVLGWGVASLPALRISNEEGEAIAATIELLSPSGELVFSGPPGDAEVPPGRYELRVRAPRIG